MDSRTDKSTSELESIYPIFRMANKYYPHFFHATTLPFYLLLGTGYSAAVMTNLLYLAVLISCAYLIGKRLYSPDAGIFFAFIVSTMPYYNLLAEDYLIDFALVSMILLGILFLVWSDNFENLLFSMLFGATLGLGMLTKQSYFLFLFIPLSNSIRIFVKNNRRKIISSNHKLILPALAFLLILSSWYSIPRAIQLFSQSVLNPKIYNSNMNIAAAGLGGLKFQLSEFVNGYSIVYSALFVLILFWPKKKEYYLWLANLVFLLAVFSFLPRDQRYIAPIYINCALVSAAFLSRLRPQHIRRIISIIVITAGLFQYLSLGYQNLSAENMLLAEPVGIDIEPALAKMENYGKKPFTVCIAAESEHFNDVNIPYFSMRGGYNVSYMIGNGCNPLNFDYTIIGPVEETWRSANFFLTKQILFTNPRSFRQIYDSGEVKIFSRI